MKHTLLNKYIEGKTTVSEERELKRLLQDTPTSQLTKEERSILELLSFTGDDAEEEDIFAVDYTEEYNKVVRPARIIRMWPWFAAACVAAILIIVLTPPKNDNHVVTPIAQVEPQQKQEKTDTMLLAQKNEPKQKVQTRYITHKYKAVAHEDSEQKESAENISVNNTQEVSTCSSSAQEQTDKDVFYAALSDVRRNALERMMSCDMQCMNENIKYRGNHLATLINEQNQ